MSVNPIVRSQAKQIHRWFTLLVLLIFLPAACSLPVEDLEGGVNTAIAETVMAQYTLTALGGAQVIPVVDTPSSSVVMVNVSVDTNCRSGPDKQYDGLGVLHVGEAAEVVGKNTVANYWVIINPDAPGTCWLWGMYATIIGDAALLPEMTPPPTPTLPAATITNSAPPTVTPPPVVEFTVSFIGICNLSGGPWANFQVTNTGNQILESAYTQIVDNTNHTNLYGPGMSDMPFRNTADCDDVTLVESTGTGATRYLRYKLSSAVPGHSIAASIELCSQDGRSGLCVIKSIHFAIP